MVPAARMRQFVDDRLDDAPMRCRFLTPVDLLDWIEAMERSLPGGERKCKHGIAKTLTLRLALLSAPLAARQRDVTALPAHATHEELIINPGCLLETLFNRGQLDRNGTARLHRCPWVARRGSCAPIPDQRTECQRNSKDPPAPGETRDRNLAWPREMKHPHSALATAIRAAFQRTPTSPPGTLPSSRLPTSPSARRTPPPAPGPRATGPSPARRNRGSLPSP